MELPLPSEIACCLTVKAGEPLTQCRGQGVELLFDIIVPEGYEVLRAKVKSAFASKERLIWSDDYDIYIRLTKHAPQKAYVKLDEEVFMPLLEKVWHTTRRRDGGNGFRLDLFVYTPKKRKQPPTTTIRRATESRIQAVLPRVQEVLEATNASYGPATLRYAATAQARLPEDQEICVPDNTTFRQMQHIDAVNEEAARVSSSSADEFAPIQVLINDSTVTLRLRVQDMRRALGLPLYPLCPPFRQPSAYVPPPDEDIEDMDHALSDEEAA